MTKVTVEPGVCGFVTKVTAEASPEDETCVKVRVASGCEAVRNMMEELPDTFDAYEVCLVKPGKKLPQAFKPAAAVFYCYLHTADNFIFKIQKIIFSSFFPQLSVRF